MCKYCKLKDIEETGEKLNENILIARMKDGSQVFDLSLNRYIDEDNDIHTKELVIDMGVTLMDTEGVYTVKDKHIKINYCPFCGEKL